MTEKSIADVCTEVALMHQGIDYIQSDIKDIKEKLDAKYVTKEQLDAVDKKYELTQRIVYGLVGLMLIAMFGALIKLVVLD